MSHEGNPLRMGMVGGGQDAFIGAVHRSAARLDDSMRLVAGALSSTPERSVRSGEAIHLSPDRTYPSWEAMLEGELALPSDQRIEVVSIVTPNHMHYPVARAFVEAGFHVILDKPMVNTLQEAQELAALVDKKGVIFCVTYNYSGYPMIKQARHMVGTGQIGAVRKVIVEYHQGWLATRLEETGQKQADWRTDPTKAGSGGAIGDIGSHAEHLARYVTGLKMEEICADLTRFVPGRALDDDASVLIRYTSGARGMLSASQICVGQQNNLRLRVWGETGGLEWQQEDPNQLRTWSSDGPEQVYYRGESMLSAESLEATRIPMGHPEAYLEAFANLYRAVALAIRNDHSGDQAIDYPDVNDGLMGVQFINAVVQSSEGKPHWVSLGR